MTYVVANNATLTLTTDGFDDLTLTGSNTDAAGNTFTIEACDEGADWGAPQAVDTAVQRWMIDGAVAATQGHDNREITFKLRLTATTSAALPFAEAALAQRAGQPALLSWTPPSATTAPTSVFEVWTWHLEPAFDSIDERHVQRIYTVTMTAKPWARSANRVSVAALSAGSVTTSVDTCASTTGWTGGGSASFGTITPSVVGGTSLKVSHAAPDAQTTQPYFLTLTRSGSVSMTTTPYLKMDMGQLPAATDLAQTNVSVDGIFMTKVASVGTVSWWQMPSGHTSFTTLTVWAHYWVQPHKTPTLSLTINDVSKVDSPATLGTGKQLLRSLTVGGSVTTTGSIKVAAPSSPIGNVILYTCADNGSGYVPAMRNYLSLGTATTDLTNTVSGAWNNITSTVIGAGYVIPPNIIRESTYSVVIRAKCATATRQPITISSTISGAGTPDVNYFYVNFTAAATYGLYTVGNITLPATPVPAESTATVNVQITGKDASNVAATAEIDLDEMYLFDTINGDLTMISMPSTPYTRLWVDSADYDPSKNRPILYQGTQDDRSDAAGPVMGQIISVDEHRLDPGGASVFLVTDAIAGASVSATFYHRWHTNAGD